MELIEQLKESGCTYSLVKQLAKIAAEKYERISGRPNEMFRMTYQPCVPETSNPVSAIRAELKKARQEDIRVGGAGCGIHREDIGLSLMGRSMKVFASQGANPHGSVGN